MTTNGQKLSPEETMGALRSLAAEDATREEAEIARVEAMSKEERRAFLRSKGVDVDKARARAAAARARLAPRTATATPPLPSAEPAEPPSSRRDVEAPPVAVPQPTPPSRKTTGSRRRPELTWLLAAATATAVGGAIAAAAHYLHHDEPPPPEPPPDHHDPSPTVKHEPAPPQPPPEDAFATAAKLRLEARRACDAREWAACLKALDAAREKDPDGENTKSAGLRELAIRGLAAQGDR